MNFLERLHSFEFLLIVSHFPLLQTPRLLQMEISKRLTSFEYL